MSEKIEIPLEAKRIRLVPVRFPDKCVYCGAAMQASIARTIERKYMSSYDKSEVTYDLAPIDIPYCEEHFNEIKAADALSEKVSNRVLFVSFAVLAIIGYPALYRPVYNWFWTPSIGIIKAFLGTVVAIGVLAGMSAGLVSLLVQYIVRVMMKPPDGLTTWAVNTLWFRFDNEQIADEFLALNKELGARVFGFKQDFQKFEAGANVRAKKSLEAREVPDESVVEASGQPQKIIGWILVIGGFLVSVGSLFIFAPIVSKLSDPASVSFTPVESITAIVCLPLPVLLFGLVLLIGGFLILRRQRKLPPK